MAQHAPSISVEEHLARILSGVERDAGRHASGWRMPPASCWPRRSARRSTCPSFDNSSMDGYAVRRDDLLSATRRHPGRAAGDRRPRRGNGADRTWGPVTRRTDHDGRAHARRRGCHRADRGDRPGHRHGVHPRDSGAGVPSCGASAATCASATRCSAPGQLLTARHTRRRHRRRTRRGSRAPGAAHRDHLDRQRTRCVPVSRCGVARSTTRTRYLLAAAVVEAGGIAVRDRLRARRRRPPACGAQRARAARSTRSCSPEGRASAPTTCPRLCSAPLRYDAIQRRADAAGQAAGLRPLDGRHTCLRPAGQPREFLRVVRGFRATRDPEDARPTHCCSDRPQRRSWPPDGAPPPADDSTCPSRSTHADGADCACARRPRAVRARTWWPASRSPTRSPSSTKRSTEVHEGDRVTVMLLES